MSASAAAPGEAAPASPERLRAAQRQCAREVRAQAANFYYAFRLLPPGKRRALIALYRFCRAADDIADGEGTAGQRRQRLELFRGQLGETLEGRPPDAGWLVLWDAWRRYQLDPAQLHDVIDGCAADCSPLEIVNQADLERYCYGVAGAVGLLSARIFGYRDEGVPALALRLGQAMQLTNILRDLREDAQLGRCYLPREELERFGCDRAELAQPGGGGSPGYRQLMAFQVARAREHFRVGGQLVGRVERSARGCPAALAALYRALLDEIEGRAYDVQSERISLGPSRKLRLALGAWLTATLRP